MPVAGPEPWSRHNGYVSTGSWGGIAGSRDTSVAGKLAEEVPGDRERLRTCRREPAAWRLETWAGGSYF